jgi:hypothetical protein
MIGFHPLRRQYVLQIIAGHARFVVYYEREHVLVGFWIIREAELHSVRQVTERICRDVLLEST